MRKLKSTIFVLALLMVSSISVIAKDSVPPIPPVPTNIVLDNHITPEFMKPNVVIRPMGLYLIGGDSKLVLQSPSVILHFGGSTEATERVAELSSTTILYRYDTNRWVQIDSVSKTAYNTRAVMAYKGNISILPGRYYYVSTSHVVKHNGAYEATNSYTNVIFAE